MTARNPKNKQKQKSPIQARRNFLHLDQSHLASRAGVATMTIQRLEAGLIPKVPQSVYSALYSENSGFSYEECNAEMEEWKSATRVANSGYLRDALNENWKGWLGLRTLISESKAGFCKLYCIHPQALDNFEKPHLIDSRTELSPYLKHIFFDAGLTLMEIDSINSRLYYHTEGISLSG